MARAEVPGGVPTLHRVCLLLAGLLASSAVSALGLGEARVSSWLHQPLDARIRLISRSEAELATVTASLASAADFQAIGLDRGLLSVPLTFEVIADLDDPHIRVRSRDPVREPVVQIVVEVVWASGRMLRQYTLFLDPPTTAGQAPLPATSPDAPAPVAEVAVIDEAVPPPEAAVIEEAAPPPAMDEEAPAMQEPATADTGGDADTVEADATAEEAAATPESEAVPGSIAPRVVAVPAARGADADNYGPVQRGETLWGIASQWSRGSGLGVNQVMLAIQQQNPGAFNRGNINSLKAGSVLRMPTQEQVTGIDAREATEEVRRQELAYFGGTTVTDPLPADELPVVATLEATADPGTAPAPDAAAVAGAEDPAGGEGHLQLVPPAAGEEGDGIAGTGNSTEPESSGDVSVVEELARAQEELANARQENDYLAERIGELEAELARRGAGEAERAGTIEDAGLAELEGRLRDERQAGEQQVVAVIPPSAERPGLARWTWWVLGVAVLLVAGLAAWLRARAREPGTDLQALAEDAEGILRSLDGGAEAVPAVAPRTQAAPAQDESAVELDADDPETRLDLARAYLSMGDLRAASRLLQGILADGDEAQVAEARRMMREL